MALIQNKTCETELVELNELLLEAIYYLIFYGGGGGGHYYSYLKLFSSLASLLSIFHVGIGGEWQAVTSDIVSEPCSS